MLLSCLAWVLLCPRLFCLSIVSRLFTIITNHCWIRIYNQHYYHQIIIATSAIMDVRTTTTTTTTTITENVLDLCGGKWIRFKIVERLNEGFVRFQQEFTFIYSGRNCFILPVKEKVAAVVFRLLYLSHRRFEEVGPDVRLDSTLRKASWLGEGLLLQFRLCCSCCWDKGRKMGDAMCLLGFFATLTICYMISSGLVAYVFPV